MSDSYEVHLTSTKGWHPCRIIETKGNHVRVQIDDKCHYDENMDNQVHYTQTEFSTIKKNVRKAGSEYGATLDYTQNMEVEVWVSTGESMPYGWYLANITKVKKNVVYLEPAGQYELEPLCTKFATRLPNTHQPTVSDEQSLQISLAGLTDLMASDFGKMSLEKIKNSKNLSECVFEEESIKISGAKEDIAAAENFIKFLIENFIYIEKQREQIKELQTKMEKTISQYRMKYKKEFKVPGEIVGLLIGAQYKKLKTFQEKYKVNIVLGDETQGYVPFTIQGNDESLLEAVVAKLKVERREYMLTKKSVSFLIGQKGERIRQIIESSQLIKIDFDNSREGDEKMCYLYGNPKAIEDGIDYIESVIDIQSLMEEEYEVIEKLQTEHDQVVQEAGLYDGNRRIDERKGRRKPKADKDEE